MNSERGEDEQQETHEDHAGHEEDSGEEAPCAVTKLTYREKERETERVTSLNVPLYLLRKSTCSLSIS